MRYVLDTNVISALRIRGRNPSVEAWTRSVPIVDQFVTATTVAEIEHGVVNLERSDPYQGDILRRWLETAVLPTFAGRILPFDLSAARILAAYPVPERAPLDDALIAAVAQAEGMTVVTRNTRHLEPLGVTCLNPWDPVA